MSSALAGNSEENHNAILQTPDKSTQEHAEAEKPREVSPLGVPKQEQPEVQEGRAQKGAAAWQGLNSQAAQ